MGLFGTDYEVIVYRNYGIGGAVFNEIVGVDSSKSEYTIHFNTDVNGKTFAFEIRSKPDLGPRDTALLEPPFEIDFNYQIEEVEEVPDYQFDLSQMSKTSIERQKRPSLPDQDVEYKFDLPFLRR